MHHLLSIESLGTEDIHEVLRLSAEFKQLRRNGEPQPLRGQFWGLIFAKSSTRTRISFEAGIRELGGDALFLSAADIQLGRGEPIRDTARVMGRVMDGAIIRTFAQNDVEEFAECSGIPTINALTDDEHPCQILADLFTIEEKLGGMDGKTVCFVGDGDCNVARSWIWAAARLGFALRIAAPPAFQPSADFMERVGASNISVTEDLATAATGADVLYTDVWVSMGKEDESAYRMAQLGAYTLTQSVYRLANPGALVMHCLPAYREKEITHDLFEEHAETIFDQAENRLHAQKAVMARIANHRSA